MTKRENLELKRSLQAAVGRLLCERGYEATSYQAIANEAGASRAIVQYYYPRKMDIADEFLNRLVEACASALGISGYSRGESLTWQEAYKVGCLYYRFLFSTEGTRMLLFDILRDRSLADELMELHCSWVAERLGSYGLRIASLSQEQLVAMGGFYELMYQSLKRERSFDIEQGLVLMMCSFVDPDLELELIATGACQKKPTTALMAKVEAALFATADDNAGH